MCAYPGALDLRRVTSPHWTLRKKDPRSGVFFSALRAAWLPVACSVALLGCASSTPPLPPEASTLQLCSKSSRASCAQPEPLPALTCAYRVRRYAAQVIDANEDVVNRAVAIYVPDLRRRFDVPLDGPGVRRGITPQGFGLAAAAYVAVSQDEGCAPYINDIEFLE